MRKVHSSERHSVCYPFSNRANRVVDGGLGSKHERADSLVAQAFRVFRNETGITCEDVVEKRGSFDEILKMRRVFLIPENGRDSLVSTI